MKARAACARSRPHAPSPAPPSAPLQAPFVHGLRVHRRSSSTVILGSVWVRALRSPRLHSPAGGCAAASLLQAEHRQLPTGSGRAGCPSDWFGWSHLSGFMGRVKSFVTGSPFKVMGAMGWTLGDALDHLGLQWGCLIPLRNESCCVPPASVSMGTEAPSDYARLEGFQPKGVLLGNNREFLKQRVLGGVSIFNFSVCFLIVKPKTFQFSETDN